MANASWAPMIVWGSDVSNILHPAGVSGCTMIVDPDTLSGVVADGAGIPSITDSIGGVVFSQVTPSLRPTYSKSYLNGHGAIVGDSSYTKYLFNSAVATSSIFGATANEAFFVFKQKDNAITSQRQWGIFSGNCVMGFVGSGSGGNMFFRTGNNSSTDGLSIAVPSGYVNSIQIGNCAWGPSSNTLWLNNVQQGTDTNFFAPNTTGNVGFGMLCAANGSSPQEPANSDLLYFCMFNRALSTTERTGIYNWLQARFAQGALSSYTFAYPPSDDPLGEDEEADTDEMDGNAGAHQVQYNFTRKTFSVTFTFLSKADITALRAWWLAAKQGGQFVYYPSHEVGSGYTLFLAKKSFKPKRMFSDGAGDFVYSLNVMFQYNFV